MRRVALALLGTITGLVFLLSFKTHTTIPSGTPASVSTTGPDQAATGASSPAGAASTPSTSTTPGATSTTPTSSSATKTVSGDAVDTRFGPVQVQVTVKNGTVTAVQAVDYPQNDPRDQQINAYAIPQLNQEALSAKSAQIDMVSGATYTSDGYISSLQSALDKAGL